MAINAPPPLRYAEIVYHHPRRTLQIRLLEQRHLVNALVPGAGSWLLLKFDGRMFLIGVPPGQSLLVSGSYRLREVSYLFTSSPYLLLFFSDF